MKLLIASRIDAVAEEQLRSRHDVVNSVGESEAQLAAAVQDRHALIFRSGVSIAREVLEAPELRLLVRAGSGIDNLDMDIVKARGLILHRIPGPGAQAVAEMTFAHILVLARSVVLADRLLRQGRWAKSELQGHNVTRKTLGVIGLGSIGTRVAELGLAWNMTVVGCVDNWTEERQRAFAAGGISLLRDCVQVLEGADFVTVHVPLEPATRNLIGRDQLDRMKPSAFLVNIARGGVVDEDALLDSLRKGRIAGAGLDVHVREGEGISSPFAELPNVVLTPHIGASTIDAQREIGEQVVRIIDASAKELKL